MDKISPKHFLFFILGTTVVSLKTYPTTFIRDGQRDSWIAIIIASIIIFIYFIYIISIWNNNKQYDLTRIYQTALGKFLGNILIYLFIATLFITLVECASVEADSLHQNMLIRTPHWYFLLFFIIPSIYTVRKDLVAVVIVTVIGIALIFISGINLGILTLPNKKISPLFPVFEYGITSGFFICILKMIGLYGCVSITLPYLSKVSDKKKKIIKNVCIGLLLVFEMQIFSIAGLIMTFGPKWLNTLNYPKLIQTQLISFLQFLDFGELYVMLQVVGGWLLKYIITFYALIIVLRSLNVRRKQLAILTYSISAIVFVAAYYVTDNIFLLFKLLNYYEYICLVNFVILPLIVFTIFKIRVKSLPDNDPSI